MTPHKQRYRHDPDNGVWGDCHRAAIASVLDLGLDDVPHFGDGGVDGEEFMRRERAFFASRGLVAVNVQYAADLPLDVVLKTQEAINPTAYYLLGGTSKNGTPHTVVCHGGRIAHDPAIDGSGIVGPLPEGVYWLTFFGTAAATEG